MIASSRLVKVIASPRAEFVPNLIYGGVIIGFARRRSPQRFG